MTNYRAILQYYSQGNTTTQIATICQCSRTTVIKTIKRAKQIKLNIPVANTISDEQLYLMLYPARGRKQDYYLPNWYELDKDRLKRSFSKRRAWKKYCRVAQKRGLKAYCKTRFYDLYNEYYYSLPKKKGKIGTVLSKIRYYTFGADVIAQQKGTDSYPYQKFIAERDSWCKGLRLDKTKIWAT